MLPGRTLPLGARTLLVGVLEAAPAPKSAKVDAGAVFEQALRLQQEGADLIDLIARPVRLGAPVPSADEELRRLVPVLRKLRRNLEVPLSVCTFSAETARRALDLGAEVINDPSGLSSDPELAKVANRFNAGLILGHSQGDPGAWARLPPLPNLTQAVLSELESAVARALRAGLDRRHIVVDPGLGRGKPGRQAYELLAHIERLAALQQPVLVTPECEVFLPEAARRGGEDWEFASAALLGRALEGGAHIVRVKRVQQMARVARVMDDLMEAQWSASPLSVEETRPAPRRRW